jgi:hypothetical protein
MALMVTWPVLNRMKNAWWNEAENGLHSPAKSLIIFQGDFARRQDHAGRLAKNNRSS